MGRSITEIEDAIIDALKRSRLGLYCTKIASFQFQGADEEEEIRLMAKSLPCVLVVYKGAEYTSLQMCADRRMTFWILAASSSLREVGESRRGPHGTYELLDDIRETLTGSRVGLSDIDPLLPLREEALVNARGFSAYYIEFRTKARYAFADQ